MDAASLDRWVQERRAADDAAWRARREWKRRAREEFGEARRHGLAARHATKLARIHAECRFTEDGTFRCAAEPRFSAWCPRNPAQVAGKPSTTAVTRQPAAVEGKTSTTAATRPSASAPRTPTFAKQPATPPTARAPRKRATTTAAQPTTSATPRSSRAPQQPATAGRPRTAAARPTARAPRKPATATDSRPIYEQYALPLWQPTTAAAAPSAQTPQDMTMAMARQPTTSPATQPTTTAPQQPVATAATAKVVPAIAADADVPLTATAAPHTGQAPRPRGRRRTTSGWPRAQRQRQQGRRERSPRLIEPSSESRSLARPDIASIAAKTQSPLNARVRAPPAPSCLSSPRQRPTRRCRVVS